MNTKEKKVLTLAEVKEQGLVYHDYGNGIYKYKTKDGLYHLITNGVDVLKDIEAVWCGYCEDGVYEYKTKDGKWHKFKVVLGNINILHPIDNAAVTNDNLQGIYQSEIYQKIGKILSERSKLYGTFEENAKTAANLWNAYLGDRLKTPITEVEFGILMNLYKIARFRNGDNEYDDNFIDAAAYTILSGDIAVKNKTE